MITSMIRSSERVSREVVEEVEEKLCRKKFIFKKIGLLQGEKRIFLRIFKKLQVFRILIGIKDRHYKKQDIKKHRHS